MPYLFVWLYLIKCVFTCLIFVDSNTKRFLSVLVVFGKYFLLSKTENFKNSVTLFWWLSRGSNKSHATIASSRVGFGNLFVSGRSSREGYTEIFAAQFVSETSSCEKHLANFSKFLAWSVLAGETGDYLVTFLSRENRVVCKKKLFFNTNLKKGLNFFLASCECSFSSLTFIFSTPPWSTPKSSTILSPFSQSSRTGMGFVLYSLFFIVIAFSSWIFCSLWYLYISWLCLGIWLSGVFIVCFFGGYILIYSILWQHWVINVSHCHFLDIPI